MRPTTKAQMIAKAIAPTRRRTSHHTPPPPTVPHTPRLPDALIQATEDLVLVNGEEALSKISMMQFSLQFMLWQQQRRRWEGIVASAVAHIEGFTDLDKIMHSSPRSSIQTSIADEEVPRGVWRDAEYIASIGAAPLLPSVAKEISLVVLPHRPQTQLLAADQAILPTTDTKAAGSTQAVAQPQIETANATATTTLSVAANPISDDRLSDNLLTHNGPPNHSIRADILSSSASIETAPPPTTLSSSSTSSPLLQLDKAIVSPTGALRRESSFVPLTVSLEVFIERLEASLYSGASFRVSDGRRIVDGMLGSSGGYAALMGRRSALLSAELGLRQHISRCATTWRMKYHHDRCTASEQQDKVDASTPPLEKEANTKKDVVIGGVSSSKHMTNALSVATTWDRGTIALLTKLAHLDPSAALRLLPHLTSRFGSRAVRQLPAVRELLHEVEEGGCVVENTTQLSNDSTDQSQSTAKPSSKFGRAKNGSMLQ